MGEGMANKKWILDQLTANADKNFVQRLFKKDAPRLDVGGGRYIPHTMSWGHTGLPNDADNKTIVYPNIIWDKKAKTLNALNGRDAQQHAEKTGEYIQVDSDEDADTLSKEYQMAVPGFLDRPDSDKNQKFQLIPSNEEKEQTQKNKIKLGLANPPPVKDKSGR